MNFATAKESLLRSQHEAMNLIDFSLVGQNASDA
jgi:hypothetical protein